MSTPANAERQRPRVRRHSRLGGREGLFWQRTSRQDTRSIVFAARRFELTERASGKSKGPLGHVGIEILELFANLVDTKTGRLEPTLETIGRYLKRSKDAIVRALKALRQFGFLDWLRRYEPTENEGRGPQVRQISNAYRLSLPEAAKRLLSGRMASDVPMPDDEHQRRSEREQMFEAHAATLSLAELPLFKLGADSELGRVLSRLGNLMQRESGGRSET